ncbi:DUF58 domain-containing protein [Bacteroidales bacterium OttesenSCG-928-K03]|nr:DUF58 domain-containing protein [Odoribacter sp. OttesenSCG-928-L07]MDL2238651.1 DUF58 domain-containing protein [Bacteroidales bacterium OttesenSCG-928-L14]MDL2240286.1 DUF58 domain-containing protein [Bacteroidales bacterium OttesenSCG-928-K22]MDL2243000.1 DUF58 domain-containing protein [Bacteroidales bacterium OttesenSCG-928-K03]
MDTKEILKKVKKIEIKSRGLSQHIFAGQYHSAFKGKGMAFSEVREYQYGDDTRSIDWNVTARYNRPFVKIFEEERELTVMLLVDVSGSNEFGTKYALKEDIITEVSAILSFSAISNNDKVGVIFFSDQIEKFIPPKKGSTHILRIIRELIDFKPKSQKTDIAEALRFLTNSMKKKTTCFILSDFISPEFENALRIANYKHDIVALRVSDPREYDIPNLGMIRTYDKESGKTIWMDTSSKKVREAYSKWWKDKNVELTRLFLRCGVDNAFLQTDKDYVKELMRVFKVRESRF